MNQGATIFSQLINLLPHRDFRRCVERYSGDKNIRTFSCWDQFLCMAFAQLTYRESLRDIEACLRAIGVKLYHLGIRGKVSRNTLAYANEKRDWRIFADFGQIIIKRAQRLLTEDNFAIEVRNAVYALDSTVIETCLSLFPWTFWAERESKGGLKAHTLLDLRRNIPVFIDITERNVVDLAALDKITVESGAFYIMDRGYIDFRRLGLINDVGSFFVIRPKQNTALIRLYSHTIDKLTGVRSDQTVRRPKLSRGKYYKHLRRISFYDQETEKRLIFLTNNFDLPAATIAALYKSRWQIELFFKWIKQHLRIEKFYGNSKNAVRTQIWIAASVYLLVAIAKKTYCLQHSHYTILQVLSVTILEKKPILQAFSEYPYTPKNIRHDNQLNLFTDPVGQ